MPELPDVELYLHKLRERVGGQALETARLYSPFLLRSYDPPLDAAVGRRLLAFRRLGKRIVWELEGDLCLVFHLMINGRFQWSLKPLPARGAKNVLAGFGFPDGNLLLTEIGSKKRASLHVVPTADLEQHDPGGLEPLTATADELAAALRRENHTLKRSLTDPRLISGIGNAFGDEILAAARLSPLQLTARLTDDEIARLHEAMVTVLTDWRDRLIDRFADTFPAPAQITASRPEFRVHGKYGEPCGICGTTVQRIRYAENETNYCPTCQTGGKVLADRSMSQLLKDDWPRSVEEWERRLGQSR